MVLVYRWVDKEGRNREWEFEDHFCFEEIFECWWERIHGIVGFEFDEAEDICPVFAWNLIHTLSYKWGVYSEEEKDDMYCTAEEFDAYSCYHDNDMRIIGYKYDIRLDDAKPIFYFELKNGLHLQIPSDSQPVG